MTILGGEDRLGTKNLTREGWNRVGCTGYPYDHKDSGSTLVGPKIVPFPYLGRLGASSRTWFPRSSSTVSTQTIVLCPILYMKVFRRQTHYFPESKKILEPLQSSGQMYPHTVSGTQWNLRVGREGILLSTRTPPRVWVLSLVSCQSQYQQENILKNRNLKGLQTKRKWNEFCDGFSTDPKY